MFDSIWWVLLLPILGSILCAFQSKELGRTGTGSVACLSILGAFAVSLYHLVNYSFPHQYVAWTWLRLPLERGFQFDTLQFDVGAYVDGLTVVMLAVVTGVAFLIHLYSTEYMSDEIDYGRYFASLNLFVATMVCLVLANNLVMLLIGWGGVGYASYSLIGFYSEKPSALAAARKAFLINVVGDIGLMVAIFQIASTIGSVNYSDTIGNVNSLKILAPQATLIGMCLLLAAYAKSAQLPLHTWLPDAMEGPTPVSALIHAATMVTAGVYLLVRFHTLFERAPDLMEAIAWCGAMTAALAACAAMAQTDLKRVLAYSTMSQLGYMFMAVGVGAYGAAIFHLVGHAFFKALLFLSAGAVIHALGGEQDMRKMRGLHKDLGFVHAVFLVGAVALAGIPLTTIFLSKEEILTRVFHSPHPGHFTLWAVALVTAGLTAYYTGRAYLLTFRGPSRFTGHIHRPGGTIEFPLLVLALLTIFGGLAGKAISVFVGQAPEEHQDLSLMVAAVLVAAAGAVIAYVKHRSGEDNKWPESLGMLLRGCFGVDSTYCALAQQFRRFCDRMAAGVDGAFSRTLPDFLGKTGLQSSQMLTLMQSGNLRMYALAIGAGVAIFIFFTFICVQQMGKLGGN